MDCNCRDRGDTTQMSPYNGIELTKTKMIRCASTNFNGFGVPIAGSDRSQKQIVEESSTINKQHFDDSSDSIIRAMMEPIPKHTET